MFKYLNYYPLYFYNFVKLRYAIIKFISLADF